MSILTAAQDYIAALLFLWYPILITVHPAQIISFFLVLYYDPSQLFVSILLDVS